MQSTAQVLQEIECGTAAEVILDSRASNDPFGPAFITELDNCLGRARPHPGASPRLERGDLIEVSGPSGSGKTTMLLFLLMTTLLPSTFILKYPNPNPIELGGRNSNAALTYPTSHPNPLPILQRRMRDTITSAVHAHLGNINSTPELEVQIDGLVKECLGRLKVIRVKPRWKEWSLAMKSILAEKGGEREGGMDLVVCDGFSDGFWGERWADESNKARGMKSRIGIRGGDISIGDVMDDITRLRKDLGAVVILSVQGLWVYNMNIQISLTGRVRPLQEPSDRTLVESLHIRDRTTQRGSMKFEGRIRVVDGADGTGMAGMRFSWTVGDRGVHAWEDAT